MKSKVRKEYEAALAKAEVTPFEGKDDVIDLYTDVVCGAVLVAEENAKQQFREMLGAMGFNKVRFN